MRGSCFQPNQARSTSATRATIANNLNAVTTIKRIRLLGTVITASGDQS